jgi:hypothetical protein
MNKKIWLGVGAAVVAAYAVYAIFFLKTTAFGAPCQNDQQCKGQCLKMSSDQSSELTEVCTKVCSAPSDCPAPSVCRSIQLTTISTKGEASTGAEKYCLLP